MAGVQMPATVSTGTVGSAAYAGGRFVDNSALEERERREEEERQNKPEVLGLAAHLRRQWQEAQTAKQHIQERLVRNLRQRNGNYDPEVEAEIHKIGGSDIFMPLTAAKCRIAFAQLSSVVLPVDDRAWDLMPTPEPEIPQDVQQALTARLADEITGLPSEMVETDDFQQLLEERMVEFNQVVKAELMGEANDARDAMRLRIEDQLEEANYREAMSQFIDDLVTFPTAFLHGPVFRRRPTNKWVSGRGLQQTVETVLEVERVSPFDIYPAPYARSLYDAYFFRRRRFMIADLEAMKGVEGYSSAAIDQVIALYGAGGLRTWISHDQERATEEGRPHDYQQNGGSIEGLQYFGPVHGAVLLDWGMGRDKVPDPFRAYEVRALLIGQYVIEARIQPLGVTQRRMYSTSYEKVPDSIWGKGVPDLLHSAQRMQNALARAFANNVGHASGPQVIINDVRRLPPGYDFTSLRPFQIWPMEGREPGPGTERPPVEFFQPHSNALELMQAMDFFGRAADEHVGIPPYVAGSDERARGAAQTASGLSQLRGDQEKSTQRIVANIDMDVTQPFIKEMYLHNLMTDNDPFIQGDLKTVARGASSVMSKELRTQRLLEALNMTANEFDIQILGPEGRAKMLRATLRDLVDDPADEILPSRRDAFIADLARQNMQQSEEPEGEPVDPSNMARVELDGERLNWERERARVNDERQAEQERMKDEEKLEQARMKHAEIVEKAKADQAKMELEQQKLAYQQFTAEQRQMAASRKDAFDTNSAEMEARSARIEQLLEKMQQRMDVDREQAQGRFGELMGAVQTTEQMMAAQIETMTGTVEEIAARLEEKVRADDARMAAVVEEIRRNGSSKAKDVARRLMKGK